MSMEIKVLDDDRYEDMTGSNQLKWDPNPPTFVCLYLRRKSFKTYQ